MAYQIMFLETTLIKVIFLTPVKDAFKIASGFVVLMDLQVLFQVAATCKRFWAIVAFERLITCMYSLVTYQIRNLTKCLVASVEITFVWFLFVMDSSMLLQRRKLRKSLITMLTFKRSVFIMGPFMLFKGLFAVEKLTAF